MTNENDDELRGHEVGAHERRAAGLCGTCRSARTQRNAKGSLFWRCARADSDPRFGRYPPLPTLACEGHQASTSGD